MSDLEGRLREAMSAAVADAEPPSGLLDLVRRRRRRTMRIAAASALALAVVVAAVPVGGAIWGRARPDHAAAPVIPDFPGGGRMLFATTGSLAWYYPDGHTTAFASGFAGATPEGTGLLAWKQTRYGFSYYTMNLDGSDPLLVLPAGHNKHSSRVGAQLSPDGSRLAYWVQDTHPDGAVTDEMWSVDGTGRKTDLGPGSGLVWKDNAAILANSADHRSLQLVNPSNGRRTTYLTVSNPRLIRAYERARPGAGPPAFISADGWSTGANPSALAVSLAARAGRTFSKPAEVIIEGGRILAFAPNNLQQPILTWGPRGVFVLHTGAGDNPASWTPGAYTGTVHGEQLSRVQIPGDPGWRAAAFNPGGNVIALSPRDGSDILTIAAVPSPACHQAGTCLHFRPKQLSTGGTLLAWIP